MAFSKSTLTGIGSNITKQHHGIFLGFMTILCWSGYNVAAKHGIDAGLSAHVVAFMRFAVPGLVALPVLTALHMRCKTVGISVRRLAALTLFGGPVFGLCAVSGYIYAPLTHGLLFASVAVFITGSILGHVLLQESVCSGRLVGVALMFVSLATLVGLDFDGQGAKWGRGAVLFIMAGMMWGVYTVLLRLWQIPMVEGTVTVASSSAIIAVPVLGLAASETLLTAHPSALAVQFVMQGLIGGVLSVVALIGAVRTLPVHVAALLPVFTPVVGLAIASALFGTLPNLAEILSVAIIAAGFVISTGMTSRKEWSKPQTVTVQSFETAR
ncbi:MAG: DMT family transporter [Roseobacter sp.]